jgi:hypothetical protein
MVVSLRVIASPPWLHYATTAANQQPPGDHDELMNIGRIVDTGGRHGMRATAA